MKHFNSKLKVAAVLSVIMLVAYAIIVPTIKQDSLAESPAFNYAYNGVVNLITDKALGTLGTAGGILSDDDVSYYRSRTNAEDANVDNYLADYSNSASVGFYKLALPGINNTATNRITEFRTQATGNEATNIDGFSNTNYANQFHDYVMDNSIAGSVSYEGLNSVVFSFISNASTNSSFKNSTVKDISTYTISGYSLRDFVWCYLRPTLYSDASYNDLKTLVNRYATAEVGAKKPKLTLINSTVSNIPVEQVEGYDIYGPYTIQCTNTRTLSGETIAVTPNSANCTIMRKTGSGYEAISTDSNYNLTLKGSSTDSFYVRVPQNTSETISLNANVKSYQESLSFRRTGAADTGYTYCAIPIMVENTTSQNVTIGTLGFQTNIKVNVSDANTSAPVNANFTLYKVIDGEDYVVSSVNNMTGGTYTFNKLSYGTYKIKLTSAAKKYDMSDENDICRTINVTENKGFVANFALKTISANVKLGIYDETGDKALSSGEVTITNVETGEQFIRLADNNGKVNIVLPYGEYSVRQTAAPYGYECPAEEYFSITKKDKVNNSSITHKTDSEDIQFYDTLFKASVSVNVIDASGSTGDGSTNFVSGAHVKVVDTKTDNTVVSEVKVTELGQKLGTLPVGNYAVVMTSAPDNYLLNDYPYEFVVNPESSSETITIPISKCLAVIQYLAYDEDNVPLKGVYIKVDNKKIDTPTDNTGSIYVSGLKAGTQHTVEAYSVPTGYVLKDATKKTITLDGVSSVSVVSDKFRKAVGSITIKLSDKANTATLIKGATFIVEFEDGTYSNYETNEKGEISVLAPTGSYKIYQKYAAEGYEKSDKVYKFSIDSAGAEKVCSYTNERVTANVTVSVKGKDVTNVVKDVNVEGAKFVLYNAETDKQVSGVSSYITSSNGNFTIKNLNIGSYYLCQTTSDSDGYYGFDKDNKINFTIKEASNVSISVTNYIKYGTIYFQYLDEDTGNGVQGATFKLYTSAGTVVSTYVSDERGQVVFSNIPYGSGYYIMMTEAPVGYELYKGKIGSGFKQNSLLSKVLDKASDVLALGMIKAHAASDQTITVNSDEISINGATSSGSKGDSDAAPSGSSADVTYEDGTTEKNNIATTEKPATTTEKPAATTEEKSSGTVIPATKIKGDIAVTVSDSNGNPIAGVTVTATKDGSAAGTATTSGSGVAVFSKMVYGTYSLKVTTAGYTSNSTTVSVSESGGTYSAKLTVSSGSSTKTSTTTAASATTETVSASSGNATSNSKTTKTLNTNNGIETLNTNRDIEALDTGSDSKTAESSSTSVSAPKTGADDMPVPIKVFCGIGALAVITYILRKTVK